MGLTPWESWQLISAVFAVCLLWAYVTVRAAHVIGDLLDRVAARRRTRQRLAQIRIDRERAARDAYVHAVVRGVLARPFSASEAPAAPGLRSGHRRVH